MTFEQSRAETIRLLNDWTIFAQRWLYHLPQDKNLICYGTGSHGHWALQAHDTAFTGFAALSAIPDTRLSSDELTATALSMFRYTFQSHHAGNGAAADGKTWGNSWISTLGLERMMHGIKAIQPALTPEDLELMQRVLTSEADWLLDSHPVTAGLTQNNHPESNMWNGTFLQRVARLYPDTRRTADYLEKGLSFLINAASIPEDAGSNAMMDGKPLKDRHLGPNFTSTYGCNHHGYMNVGYMVITLSNLAMFHFACKDMGWTPPESLYLHAREIWQVVKTCTFPDGRLWRIGGDSRVRYCYCQDYAIPVWLFARDYLGDTDTSAFENNWIKQVATEAAVNGNGSFLGRRLQRLESTAPLYYTRLEGDRVCSLSMALTWGPQADAAPAGSEPVNTLAAWHDDLHGASLVNEQKRRASWCWRASELPQGMCLPPDASDMAEWRYGLSGHIQGIGIINSRHIRHNSDTLFDGGFATCGQIAINTDVFIGEGETSEDIALIDLAFAALPDGQTVVGFQHAHLLHRTVIRECKGLYLLIPNDCYNRNTRRYNSASGTLTLQSQPVKGRLIGTNGNWLAIDDKIGVLGIYGGTQILLNRPDEPQVIIHQGKHQSHTTDAGGLLYADEICFGACSDDSEFREPGTLFDIGYAVRSSITAEETEAWSNTESQRLLPLDNQPLIRAARISGADKKEYIVASNFGENAEYVRLALEKPSSPAAVDNETPVTTKNNTLEFSINAGSTRVIRL